MQKVQELTGQVVVGALPEAGIPRLLERDLARKYKKRAFTPTLSTVYDVPVQGKLRVIRSSSNPSFV